MKILVVDDSRAMRRIVQQSISQSGLGEHETIEAENGRQALDLVEPEQPDLILSDWQMPVMDGLEFLKALKAAGNDTPFGFVTSFNSPEMRETAKENGATFLLVKPFTAEDMKTVLSLFIAG